MLILIADCCMRYATSEKPSFNGFCPLLFIVSDSFMGVIAGGTAAVLPPTEDSYMASDTVVIKLLTLPAFIIIDFLLRSNFGNCFLGFCGEGFFLLVEDSEEDDLRRYGGCGVTISLRGRLTRWSSSLLTLSHSLLFFLKSGDATLGQRAWSPV